MDPIRPNFSNTPAQTQTGNQNVASDLGGQRSQKNKQPVIKKVIKWAILGVVILVIGFLGWQYTKAQSEIKRLSNPQEAAQEETKKLTNDLSKLIELPQDETPTIATVVDASKLKEQAFFARSENGDRVIIYTQNRKAILYRPSTKKIIEVAPINIGDNNNSSDQQQ